MTPNRVFWCAMLLLHGAAIPSLCRGLGLGGDSQVGLAAWARLLGLLVSAAFFVLKIGDVSWLRMKPGWRSMATAIVIVGLLHLGVLERTIQGDFELSAAHPGVVLFVAAAWGADALRQGPCRLASILIPIRLLRPYDHLGDPVRNRSWESAFQPLLLFFVPSYTAPRAPPSA